MKIKTTFVLLIILGFTTISLAGDYPKSRVENEMDEMGSVLKGEGLVFRPGKTKSTATKSKIGNVNKYLYQATLEVLDFVPLTSADSVGGVIITEWYNPKGQPNTQLKINVFIKDEVISVEALDVKAYERSKIDNKWSEDYKESAIASILEDKIIRRARTLYQAEK
jgi:hypothetical protein